jgi:hypothetical protein
MRRFSLSLLGSVLIASLLAAVVAPASAAPKSGKGGGGTKTVTLGDFIAHPGAFTPLSPLLVSRCSGTATLQMMIEWPRHDLCVATAFVDANGAVLSLDAGVKPFGSIADPDRVKELCEPDELCDDPELTISKKKDRIHAVRLYIQDDIGADGIMHETDVVIVDPPATIDKCGFVVHVHADNVPVWRLSGHLGGPRVAMVGTVSIGDIWYRPDPSCGN